MKTESMKKKPKSARADGRGGWIPGKRRNPDVGDWSRLRIDLAAILDDHWQWNVRTPNALARDLSVSQRTVRRWLSGEDRPSPVSQEAVRRWITEQRRLIKSAAKP